LSTLLFAEEQKNPSEKFLLHHCVRVCLSFCCDTCSQFAFSQCPQFWLKHFHFILLQQTIKRTFVELAVSVMEVGVVFILRRQLFQPLLSLIWSIASIFLSVLFLQ